MTDSHEHVKVVRTAAELRNVVASRRVSGERIGLVPTMGALHEGHLSLIRQARAECDFVVMSLFVNPTQFNEQRDLDAYPRNEEADVREPDGLAMSSRNVRLTPQARKQSLGLIAALRAILHGVRHGERGATALVERGMKLLASHGIDAAHVDYLAIVNAETLSPVEFVTGPVLVVVAAHVGGVRLIDNLIVEP